MSLTSAGDPETGQCGLDDKDDDTSRAEDDAVMETKLLIDNDGRDVTKRPHGQSHPTNNPAKPHGARSNET